jgi:2-keto-4-pentenoate hydratase/2-oxohepta-3-ene-1,7-dioic acid hydratase in catechol pathway
VLAEVGVGIGERRVLHAGCLRRFDRETSAAGAKAAIMRYVSYSENAGHPRPGVIEGESVRPFGADVHSLDAFIALTLAERAAAVAKLGAPVPLASVKLHAPLHPKKNVFCVGRNYLAHAEEGARVRGEKLDLPDVPTYFSKAPTAIAGPDQVLELSSDVSPKYDWEAELGVVIGTTARDVPEADALSVIFGYMCLNDVTARDLQRSHIQWFKGKSLDNSCPIGPWIVDAADVGDAQKLDIKLRVNGVEKQSSNTSKMIFNLKQIIANLSHGITLHPGDIIASGTPEGVGFARVPPEYLKDGDVMEVEIEKVGILRNAVHIAPDKKH